MRVMLVQYANMGLIVPVSIVVEVSRIGNWRKAEQAPMIGFSQWRNYQVPLLDAMALCNSTSQDELRHVVILWPMKDADKSAYMGIPCQRAPRIITVNEEELSALSNSDIPTALQKYAIAVSEYRDKPVVIPNLSEISATFYPAKS